MEMGEACALTPCSPVRRGLGPCDSSSQSPTSYCMCRRRGQTMNGSSRPPLRSRTVRHWLLRCLLFVRTHGSGAHTRGEEAQLPADPSIDATRAEASTGVASRPVGAAALQENLLRMHHKYIVVSKNDLPVPALAWTIRRSGRVPAWSWSWPTTYL